jgi:hypothetical protein
MTLGRLEEVLDEVQAEAKLDYRPETFRYILEALNAVRERLLLDTRGEDGE